MQHIVDVVQPLAITWGLRVLAAVAILVVGRWLARVLAGGLERVMARARQDEMLTGFVRHLVYYALLAFVVIAALSQLGIQTTSFIAVLGAAGLAVGLALQGSLANFAAGVMLVVFRPFKVGDYVEAGGAAGIVEEIQIFGTRFRTGDNKQVHVPNGAIFSGTIVNYSAKDTRRVDLVFSCAYEDDIRKAKSVLTELVEADERVLSEPAPTVAVSALGESSVDFVVRPWVKSGDYWAVYWGLTEAVKLRFDAEGISIPYPQRDVHLHSQASG